MEQQPRERSVQIGVETSAFAILSAVLRPLYTLLPTIFPYNLSPVGGLAIFSGARLRSGLAFLVPVAVMVFTDLVLWAVKGSLYSPWHVSRPFVYASFLMYVVVGRLMLKKATVPLACAASLIGSVQFFLVTNFGAWLELTTMYERGLGGLMKCYAQGLPFFNKETPTSTIGFFGFTLIGDLLFTAVFFGIDWLGLRATSTKPALESSRD